MTKQKKEKTQNLIGEPKSKPIENALYTPKKKQQKKLHASER